MATKFNADQEFDGNKMRHYLNGETHVLHCHHYSALFTQLADDSRHLHGPELLCQSAEEVFHRELENYFRKNKIDSPEDRNAIAEDYFSFVGLGKLKIRWKGDQGTAEMPFSHVDQGWIKKWSRRDKPVNFIGQGYIAGACAAIAGRRPGTFEVEETESIVSGKPVSKFTIRKK